MAQLAISLTSRRELYCIRNKSGKRNTKQVLSKQRHKENKPLNDGYFSLEKWDIINEKKPMVKTELIWNRGFFKIRPDTQLKRVLVN